jgi:hypothetical protein
MSHDWTPPAWIGVTLPVWIGLMRRYRFPVAADRLGRFLLPTAMAPLNSLAAAAQALVFGRQIEAVGIDAPPVFIVGFLRTGTTWMHELLASDPRHTAPATYQCMAPEHFLITRALGPLVARLLARRRAMDDMEQGWERPFEDEFALCLSGLDSPYYYFFFPQSTRPTVAVYGDGPDDPPSLERWKTSYVRFLKAVVLARPGRLVLKSPPHTARIDRLVATFPASRFVHMVRNPLGVVPSAIHTVRALIEVYGLQHACRQAIEDWVVRHFELMNRRWDEDRARLPPGHFIDVRYEDLVADPMGELERIYAGLGLGPFALARDGVERYLAGVAGYRTNRFTIDGELRRRIVERFGPVMRQYGYGS